jgi:hypothetical protein
MQCASCIFIGGSMQMASAAFTIDIFELAFAWVVSCVTHAARSLAFLGCYFLASLKAIGWQGTSPHCERRMYKNTSEPAYLSRGLVLFSLSSRSSIYLQRESLILAGLPLISKESAGRRWGVLLKQTALFKGSSLSGWVPQYARVDFSAIQDLTCCCQSIDLDCPL